MAEANDSCENTRMAFLHILFKICIFTFVVLLKMFKFSLPFSRSHCIGYITGEQTKCRETSKAYVWQQCEGGRSSV